MKSAKPALRLTLTIFILCGFIYPAFIYLTGNTLFPDKVSGSLLYKGTKLIGSALIGQYNQNEKYFWPRPTTNEKPYDPTSAGASHMLPHSKAYEELIRKRYAAIRKAHPYYEGDIPVDMLTGSASGLDPHISPATAYIQVKRVADARNLNEKLVKRLVDEQIEPRQFGVLGNERVNVLKLNLALDEVTDE